MSFYEEWRKKYINLTFRFTVQFSFPPIEPVPVIHPQIEARKPRVLWGYVKWEDSKDTLVETNIPEVGYKTQDTHHK